MLSEGHLSRSVVSRLASFCETMCQKPWSLAARIRQVRSERFGTWSTRFPVSGSTLALAHVSMRSRSPVERAMSAAVLASFALPPELERAAEAEQLPRLWEAAAPESFDMLRRLEDSQDRLAAQIAAARLGLGRASGVPAGAQALGSPAVGDSITVHGTWSRMTEAAWYRPGDDTHAHILRTCTTGLYAEDDYYRWSGGYSHAERDQGSADLVPWLSRREIQLDTAFGHSHGGNVLLGAELSHPGALLVMMHTPVLPRSDTEWARIAGTWHRVLVMRARADPVVIADGLRTGSTGEPDRNKLPFRVIRPHVKDRRGWFTHGMFVQAATWRRYRLSNEITYERKAPTRIRPQGSDSAPLRW